MSTTALNGFTGSVALSVSGLPAGATATFAPSSIAGAGAATLTVATLSTTPVGPATLTITGTSAARVARTSKITLVVNPVGDFGMTASASTITVARGSFAKPYVYLTALNGFYANVYLSTSTLPTGVTAAWGAAYLLTYGTTVKSTYVKITAASTAVPGTYTIDLIGTTGPIVYRVPLTITVT